MVGTGHNGFLLPVVDWMGWWFATSFFEKEKQETVSDFLLGGAAGRRLYSVLKVRVRLAR
jgi:zinc transporter ZupT